MQQSKEMKEADFLKGIPLGDALFEHGDIERLTAYQATLKNSQIGFSADHEKGLWENFAKIAKNFQNYQNKNYQRREITAELQKDILKQIQNSTLIAYGFQKPRNISDKAVQIPPDLFSHGEIDWRNSELISQNLEFSGIRVFPKLHSETKSEMGAPSPPKEKFIADYDPSFMVGEKEAGRLLGISPRTLQGYRGRGGGPEFHKYGKAVKYKIADLIGWLNAKKKRSTSE